MVQPRNSQSVSHRKLHHRTVDNVESSLPRGFTDVAMVLHSSTIVIYRYDSSRNVTAHQICQRFRIINHLLPQAFVVGTFISLSILGETRLDSLFSSSFCYSNFVSLSVSVLPLMSYVTHVSLFSHCLVFLVCWSRWNLLVLLWWSCLLSHLDHDGRWCIRIS